MVPSLHAVSLRLRELIYRLTRNVSYPLTLLGNFVYSLANRLHLIPSSGADLELGSYAQVPGTARAEAERRRYLTLLIQYAETYEFYLQSNGFEGTGPTAR